MVGAFFGAIMFVGVILAYIERGKITDLWLESHVEKQIRTFWIWLTALVVLAVGVVCGVAVLPITFELFAGDSVVALGLFLYVLISSIVSFKTLARSELTESFYSQQGQLRELHTKPTWESATRSPGHSFCFK